MQCMLFWLTMMSWIGRWNWFQKIVISFFSIDLQYWFRYYYFIGMKKIVNKLYLVPFRHLEWLYRMCARLPTKRSRRIKSIDMWFSIYVTRNKSTLKRSVNVMPNTINFWMTFKNVVRVNVGEYKKKAIKFYLLELLT